MNIKELKQPYRAPLAEAIILSNPINLLVTASVDATIEDFETGEDL